MRQLLGSIAMIVPFAVLTACGQGGGGKAPPATPEAPQTEASEAEMLLTSLVTPRQKGPYAPRDECGAINGAEEFRLKLAQAVIDRNTDAFVALAAPDIALDFGGGSGRAELRRRLMDPQYNLWEALQNLLPLGCAVNQQGGFTMPWYFTQDFGNRDSYTLLLVRGEGVPLLASQRRDAKVLRTFDWDIVKLEDSTDEDSAFAKVDDYGKLSGYMEWDKLRALVDYRLIVEEREDGWVISAFVAGD